MKKVQQSAIAEKIGVRYEYRGFIIRRRPAIREGLWNAWVADVSGKRIGAGRRAEVAQMIDQFLAAKAEA